jgi:hypothetical protein
MSPEYSKHGMLFKYEPDEDSFFIQTDLETLERLYEGQSKDEGLGYFGVEYKDLSDSDKKWVDRAYKRGRVSIRDFALHNLKQQMSNSKNGMGASLAALSRLASEWTISEQVSKVKSFKIELDD